MISISVCPVRKKYKNLYTTIELFSFRLKFILIVQWIEQYAKRDIRIKIRPNWEFSPCRWDIDYFIFFV